MTFDISKKLTKKNSACFIKYENTLGNWKIVIWIAILLYSIIIFFIDLFPLFFRQINELVLNLIHLVIYLLMFIMLFYFTYKVRKNNDIYRIGNELLYVLINLGM